MPKNTIKSADTAPEPLGNNGLAKGKQEEAFAKLYAEALESPFLEEEFANPYEETLSRLYTKYIDPYLNDPPGIMIVSEPGILAFSHACRAARRISSKGRENHALTSLLNAVICGDGKFARKIVMSHPELLLLLRNSYPNIIAAFCGLKPSFA